MKIGNIQVDHGCTNCGKEIKRPARPIVSMSFGCLKQLKKSVDYRAIDDKDVPGITPFIEVSYRPKESEKDSHRPKRRQVYTEIHLLNSYGNEGELPFCSFLCMRRWMERLISHVESQSKVKKSDRNISLEHTIFPAGKPQSSNKRDKPIAKDRPIARKKKKRSR